MALTASQEVAQAGLVARAPALFDGLPEGHLVIRLDPERRSPVAPIDPVERPADPIVGAQVVHQDLYVARFFPKLRIRMIKIVPTFKTIFEDFGTKLPPPTQLLIEVSNATARYWYVIPLFPLGLWLIIKLIRKFKAGRIGWDMFTLNWPVFGMLIEKNTMAKTTRTLGTLVASGVPILESLNITRETCGNAMFERLFGKVSESIREGETIAQPLKDYSAPGFHPIALMLWMMAAAFPGICMMVVPNILYIAAPLALVCSILGGLFYFTRMNRRVVNDLVVNMVDVGEETGELDTMLYKVADTFDDEVEVITDSLMSLLEPLLIVFLGGAVAFIVISLFMPLVSLIQTLS